MTSPQSLTVAERHAVAVWAADCAERVADLFEAEAPGDTRVRDAISRTRAFARGELLAADEIRQRFMAGRAASAASSPAAKAAARAAAQAAAVAHMGAHALGAAAYAVKAVVLATPDLASAADDEVRWQLEQMSTEARNALQRLPVLGENSSGPLGPGLLTTGILAATIRRIQAEVKATTEFGAIN